MRENAVKKTTFAGLDLVFYKSRTRTGDGRGKTTRRAVRNWRCSRDIVLPILRDASRTSKQRSCSSAVLGWSWYRSFRRSAIPQVACAAEADFSSNCMIIDQYGGELEPVNEYSSVQLYEPSWKRVTTVMYTAVFTLMWVCGVASFYFFGTAFKNGSSEPTATQTEAPRRPWQNSVRAPERQRVHVLQLVSWVSVPAILITGAVLHLLVGEKLFPNTPTLAEFLNRDKKPELVKYPISPATRW